MKDKIHIVAHIEICGVIASGKSTITNILGELGYVPVLEKFEINPFLQQFYETPEDHALETEIAFLIQHYNHIKRAKKENKPFACDFSLLLDLVFADVTLSEKEKRVFLAVYNEISEQISLPDAIVYLTCDPAVLLERIKKRGRKVENNIDIDYLTKLDNAHSNRISEVKGKTKIITIDSKKYDFAHKTSDMKQVLSLLIKEIG